MADFNALFKDSVHYSLFLVKYSFYFYNIWLKSRYKGGIILLKSLEIDNFKGIKNVKINDLNHINLFGGKNNIGKTTILEALFMFYDRFNPLLVIRQFNRRGVSSFNLAKSHSIWEPLFYEYNSGLEVKIQVKRRNGFTEKLALKVLKGDLESKINLTNDTLLNNSPKSNTGTRDFGNTKLNLLYKSDKGEEESNIILDGEQITLDSSGRPHNIDNLTGVFLSSKNHSNAVEEAEKFGQLEMYGESDKILDFLKIMENRLRDLTTITANGDTMLYADIGIGRKVPIYYMGDGFVRLVSIILSVATAKNGFLIIDEFENGLHYSIMPEIWESIAKAAKEYNCQLFISTHSYECLQAAHEGIKQAGMNNSFVYHRVFKDTDSKLLCKSINHSVLGTALDANMEVR
ncbi:hypothetical protein COL08_27880 [Priestia megaterium]|nr:hypothetical protein COL08_27880 [Priestia megaterium]